MPTCWVIAGPNGAGKTTFALNYLPKVVGCTQFINADLIAAGLSPLAADRELLAGRSYLRLIKKLQMNGWRVELIYLALPSVEISKMRVEERVLHGGHNIPVKDIECRFPRSLAKPLNEFSFVDDECQCYLYQNELPEPVFEQQGELHSIVHQANFKYLSKEAAHG